jgi:hypothetical protein
LDPLEGQRFIPALKGSESCLASIKDVSLHELLPHFIQPHYMTGVFAPSLDLNGIPGYSAKIPSLRCQVEDQRTPDCCTIGSSASKQSSRESD